MGSELPEARPAAADETLTWATDSGARGSGPSGAKKASGWLFQEAPAYDYFNWWQGMVGDLVAWLTGNTIRTFDTLAEGIAQTTPGDTFRLKRTGAIPSRAVSDINPFGTGFGVICTDGVRVYVHDKGNDGIHAYRCDDITSGEAIWEQEGLAGYSGINRIDTDGELVVIVRDADGLGNIHILDASDGSIVDEFKAPDSEDVYDCCAASSDGTRRAYWCEESRVMQWTPSGGATVFVDPAATIPVAVCVGPDYVHVATLGVSIPSAGHFRTYDLAGTLQGNAHAMTDAASHARIATDGEHIFAATWDDSTPDSPSFYKLGVLEAAVWTAPSTWSSKYTAGTGAPDYPELRLDDKYVYVNDDSGNILAFSKESGHFVYAWGAETYGDFCVDGDRLYVRTNDSKIYIYQARMRAPGALWARVGNGGSEDEGLNGVRRTPFRNLALPL